MRPVSRRQFLKAVLAGSVASTLAVSAPPGPLTAAQIEEVRWRWLGLAPAQVIRLSPPGRLRRLLGRDDMTADLQRAIDRAATTGGVIQLAPGRYRIRPPLTITADNVSIIGSPTGDSVFTLARSHI